MNPNKKREFPLAQVYGLLEPGPVVLVTTARAFAGKLVPQGPSEEPAEKLLERIRLKQNNPLKPGKRK